MFVIFVHFDSNLTIKPNLMIPSGDMSKTLFLISFIKVFYYFKNQKRKGDLVLINKPIISPFMLTSI